MGRFAIRSPSGATITSTDAGWAGEEEIVDPGANWEVACMRRERKLSVRVDEALAAAIHARARADGLSVSRWMRQLLSDPHAHRTVSISLAHERLFIASQALNEALNILRGAVEELE
jgi:hypothetical protein